jgi:hypothetical protein
MDWLDDLMSFLNSATGGQITHWTEGASDKHDPLKKVWLLHLHEPFAKDQVPHVRAIIKSLALDAGYALHGIAAGPPLKITAHKRTPNRDKPAWLRKKTR